MLSKLDFAESGHKIEESLAERQALREAVERYFGASGGSVSIAPASGGTLGVCFHLDISGATRFLKTHLPAEQLRANLAKEGDLLLYLYGGAVVLDRMELRPEIGPPRLCLVMAELSPLPAPIDAEAAAALARSYMNRLSDYQPADPAAGPDFEQYLAHGFRAVAALSELCLIEARTAAGLERQLDLLRRTLGALPRALCHGDFGPKNIMTDGSRPVVIDWEDAFWGVAGYDYLYWLTFMDNRRFLHDSAFGRTGLDPAVERAILALVVLLKSFLSVRSGAHIRNTVPVEARIAEVLALPQAS